MQFDRLKRREFITLLGGATAWPLAARAQQPERLRRIGVLTNRAADNPEGQDRLAALHQGLQELTVASKPGKGSVFTVRVPGGEHR